MDMRAHLLADSILETLLPADRLMEVQIFYKIPKDKKVLLYDFYMLSYLKGLLRKRKVQGPAGEYEEEYYPAAREDTNLDYSVNEAIDTLYPALKQELLDATFFAVCAEIRHVFDNHSNLTRTIKGFENLWREYAKAYQYSRKSMADREELTNVFGVRKPNIDKPEYQPPEAEALNNEARLYSFASAKRAIKKTGRTEKDFIQMAEKIFDAYEWNSAYGGEAWARICAGWLSLNAAKTVDEMGTWIDHVYDLQHNTDTVFNKLKSYYGNYVSGYSWIKKALDHKASIKSPYEMIGEVSGGMKKMATAVIKSRMGVSLDQWRQKNKKTTPEDEKTTPEDEKLLNQLNAPIDNWHKISPQAHEVHGRLTPFDLEMVDANHSSWKKGYLWRIKSSRPSYAIKLKKGDTFTPGFPLEWKVETALGPFNSVESAKNKVSEFIISHPLRNYRSIPSRTALNSALITLQLT